MTRAHVLGTVALLGIAAIIWAAIQFGRTPPAPRPAPVPAVAGGRGGTPPAGEAAVRPEVPPPVPLEVPSEAPLPTDPGPPPPAPDEETPAEPPPGRRLVFALQLRDGTPLAGALARGWTAGGALGVATADSMGNASLALPIDSSSPVHALIDHPLLAAPTEIGPFRPSAERVVVALPPGRVGSLSVVVEDATTRAAVEGALVHVIGSTGAEFILPVAADPGGAGFVVRLREGTWSAAVSGPGYARSDPRTVDIMAGQTSRLSVRIQRSARLTGRVVPRPGMVLYLADIEMEMVQGPDEFPATPRRTVRVECREGGRFTLADLPPGRYRIRAQRAQDPSLASGWAEVAVEPGASADAGDLVLRERPAGIAGTVAGPDGNPLPGVAVRCGPESTATDANGAYALYGPVPGPARVSFQAEGYAPAIREVAVGDEPLRLDVRLDALGCILGEVRRHDGSPAAGVEVSIDAEGRGSRQPPIRAVTDPQGRFYVADIPPGSCRLTVPGVAGAPAVDVDVAPGSVPATPVLVLP